MAMSRGLPVFLKSPWEKNLCTVTGRTPMPICMPTGSRPPFWVCVPAIWSVWYIRSSNSALLFLNPVVFTLARLFESVSMWVCMATMPVAAVQSERIIAVSLLFIL